MSNVSLSPISVFILVLLAATLAVSPLMVMADPEEWRLYYGILCLLLTVLSAGCLIGHFQFNAMLRAGAMFLLIAVPPELSALANDYDDPRLLKILAVVGLFAILGPLALHSPQRKSFRFLSTVTVAFLVISTILVLFLSANSSEIRVLLSDRRAGFDLELMGLHPNYGGLLATATAVVACGLASPRWRLAVLPFCLFVCWLMESRGGLLGVGGAFVIGYACQRLPRQADPAQPRFLVQILAACAALLLLVTAFGSQLGEVVSRDILLLDDDYRGLDTGFSGRTEVWQEAWNQWLSHPVFGFGFLRELDEGGTEDMNRAHSLPLTLLSETGLVGFAGFMGFSVWGLRNGMRLGRSGNVAAGSIIITSVVVYWVYGIFEGLAINVGNPLSALFFLVVFASAVEDAPS